MPEGYNVESVLAAIEAIRAGRMVIMIDDEDRENEGDLVFAAEHSTPQLINFMAKEARGLICLTLETEIVDRLKLPMMGDSTKRAPDQGTAFTVSIEARDGVTTGISAADRSHTIQVAIASDSVPEDIVVPGHIFPLKAKKGGVLARAGHTEGSVDIAKLAGCRGAGVICEIMNDDGTMARMPDLEAFSKKHGIPIVAIADLIKHRLHKEPIIREISRRQVETSQGVFEGVVFQNLITEQTHLTLVKGRGFADQMVDVRVHNGRPLADVFGSKSGAGFRLDYGLKLLKEKESAVFIYLNEEDEDRSSIAEDMEWLVPGGPKPSSPLGQQSPMDDRMLGTGAQILRALGVEKMRIHTTSQRNFVGLKGYGLEVAETKIMMTH